MKSMHVALLLGLLRSPGLSQTTDRNVPTANQMLAEAEATASSQHKNVMLIFSASWCASCHLQQIFLADPAIRPIFDKYFVKLVVVHGERANDKRHQDTPGVDQLLDSLHDTNTSVPLTVILSNSGKFIVDSVRPVYGRRDIRANTGFPDGPTGTEWFFEMLRRGAPSLTSSATQIIHTWLLEHGSSENTK